jgi:succinate-acetate transporter protein
MTHAPTDTARGTPVPVDGQDTEFWRSHTQISLSPIAAPSILGLFGFAGATFMVAASLAGWYTSLGAAVVLFPFAMVFGGLAQFLAGMWAYRARDGVATAMHGMWGSFWLAFGIYMFLVVARVFGPLATAAAFVPGSAVTARPVQLGFGWWFIILAAITWAGALAALASNLGLTLTLATLAAGSTILAIAWVTPFSIGVQRAGGDVLVASAVIAFYTAAGLMMESAFGRAILPTGHMRQGRPLRARPQPIQYELGDPGVKLGQ